MNFLHFSELSELFAPLYQMHCLFLLESYVVSNSVQKAINVISLIDLSVPR